VDDFDVDAKAGAVVDGCGAVAGMVRRRPRVSTPMWCF
jgi:hypothetical protein